MSHSESLDLLAGALCAAQSEFTAIPKDSTNPFFKSSYAGLPKVVEVASPILTKHGLSISQFLGVDEHGDTLTTWLLHESGQFISEAMRLHLSKDDAQGQGSATTYARRYSYMAVLGLVADEDDDGSRASQKAAGRVVTPAPRPALLTPEQRKRVLEAIKVKRLPLELVLAHVDVADVGLLTAAHARKIKAFLDAESDVPSDFPSSEPDPELEALAKATFGDGASLS